MGRAIYSDYFGMSESAFSITPDPRFLFMSERHCEALAHLRYGVTESGCFILLTGEVGSGKTTTCRALLEQLPENVDVALLLSPPRTWQELLLSIADELHVVVKERHASQHELVSILTQRLLQNYGQGRRTVVIIDEAQNIPHDVLEQVRLLTNLETHTDKLLHVILVGQPELRDLLLAPSLRQVAQRITARYHLEPLSNSETQAYVCHRLRVVGYQQGLFTKGALRALYNESEGIPRVINILCDRALLGAYANDKSQVTSSQIRQAASQWRGEQPKKSFWFRYRVAVVVAIVGFIGTTTMVYGYADKWQNVEFVSNLRTLLASVSSAQITKPPVNVLSKPQASSYFVATEVNTTDPIDVVRHAPERMAVSNVPANIAKPIPTGIRIIGPHSPPEAIRWLRGELDRIDGTSSSKNDAVYDSSLRKRVIELQRKNGLVADGVAGPVTLNYMHVLYGTSVPSLAELSGTASGSGL